MPFFDVGRPVDEFELTPGMPLPLKVSICDKAQEREGRTTAVLIDSFGYLDKVEKLRIVVPKQFRTDFASIPGWARRIVSPFGRHAKAAVIHDWLYAIGEPGRRDIADRVFDHAMEELDVDDGARELMFGAVRIGGHDGYANAEKDWPETFADEITGDQISPLFARSTAFVDQPNGPQRVP
jgi:hypothetical protein